MTNSELEYWEALRMYSAVKEVCLPFAATAAGAAWHNFGGVAALLFGPFVYFVFMAKAKNRKRRAISAYQDAKPAEKLKDAA